MDELIESVAQAIYDAPDSLSGDYVGTVIYGSEHLMPSAEHLDGNSTGLAYKLAAMQVCRDAAKAVLALPTISNALSFQKRVDGWNEENA